MNIYERQFVEIYNNANYNVNTIFDVTIALLTNTVIYKDLPLDVMEQFEEDIGWGKKGTNENLTAEFANPFVTHLNPETRVCITAFVPNNEQMISDGPYGIQLMHFLAQEHKYNYKVAVYGEIKRIIDTCNFNRIPPDNVICIGMDTIKVISSNIKMKNSEATAKATSAEESASAPITNTVILRKYQQDILKHMESRTRDIIKLPCGMGKSMIMIMHMLGHRKNSIILVPNVALVEQFEKNIKKVYNLQLGQLPIIHMISNKSDNENLKVTPDWVDESYIPQHIIISVYNSFILQFLNRSSANGIYALNYEYLYIDEAHHIILPSKPKIRDNIQKLLQEFMKDYNESIEHMEKKNAEDAHYVEVMKKNTRFQMQQKVIVEANALIKAKEREDNNDFVVKMKNTKLGKSFAELIYKYMGMMQHSYLFSATIQPSNICPYNMFGAIQAGFLCKLNIDILIDTHFDSATEIPFIEKVKNMAEYLVKSQHKHIIIYTSRVNAAREIHKALPFKSAVVTASLSTETRQGIFDKFRAGTIRALLTVNCISEGVDLPCADCAVFFDDKHSIINIIQCVGRVMRLCENKISSTLVLTAYKSDDINDIYQNTLSVINGELGYGNADIRRCVRVVMNMDIKILSRCEEIKQKVYRQVYEYNERYFSEICLLSKIATLGYLYKTIRKIPILETNIVGDKLIDGDYYNLAQFVHDNLYLPNTAGKLLRNLYGIDLQETINEPVNSGLMLTRDTDDKLVGGSADDILVKNSRNESLVKNNTDDKIINNSSNDKLVKNNTDDKIINNSSNDKLIGGSADDILVKNSRNEQLTNKSADDILVKNNTDDVIPNDQLISKSVNEQLASRSSNDKAVKNKRPKNKFVCKTFDEILAEYNANKPADEQITNKTVDEPFIDKSYIIPRMTNIHNEPIVDKPRKHPPINAPPINKSTNKSLNAILYGKHPPINVI